MNRFDHKIGIVILNYNTKELTINLVNSISDFEIIHEICVVDNNSNDNFDNSFNHRKVKYIKSLENNGYSSGNNIGLKFLINERDCDIVFIANPDTSFTNKTVSEIVYAFDNNQKLAIISSKRYGINGSLIHQYFDFPDFKRSLFNCFFLTRYRFEEKRYNKQYNNLTETNILIVDAIPGAFFGMKADFIKRIGFLREDIFLYGEELFLGKEAVKLGLNAAILSNITYFHNHKNRGPNFKMFYLDRVSLLKYFKEYNILNNFQLAILKIAIISGTLEYIILSKIQGIIRRR